MIIIWSFGAFGSFLIPYYLTTLDGNVFVISIFSSLAEVIASIVCGTITRFYDLKKILIFFCMFSFVAAFLLVFLGNGDNEYIALLILFANFGIISTFDICYLINVELFPTIFLATAFGMCNIIGRFVSIMSPLIAKMEHPYPMIILVVYAAIASGLGFFLKKVKVK